jgi:hypothetical protein
MIPTYPTPPTSTLEHLTRIRTVLSDPSHWTKGTMGLDIKHGDLGQPEVLDPDRQVMCCCLLGAAYRTSGHLDLEHGIHDIIGSNMGLLRETVGMSDGIVCFNDHSKTTHADILAALVLAIESLS